MGFSLDGVVIESSGEAPKAARGDAANLSTALDTGFAGNFDAGLGGTLDESLVAALDDGLAAGFAAAFTVDLAAVVFF